jgi:hypothetical protein
MCWRRGMNRIELRRFEVLLEKEVERRRSLGGYNTDAECIMLLTEAIYKIVQHIIEKEASK